MLRVIDFRDAIHGRLERLRRRRAVLELADAMLLSRATLQKFLDGDKLVSLGTLTAIEEWCDREEAYQEE